MGNPYCVFCGETVAEGSAFTCSACSLRGCGTCAAEGHDTCPDCGQQMVAATDAQASAPASPGPDAQQATPLPPPPPRPAEAAVEDGAALHFDVHQVDPLGWRRDPKLGKRQAGPTIVFSGVSCGLVVVLSIVCLFGLYFTGHVNPAKWRLPVDLFGVSTRPVTGTWGGEFAGQIAVLHIEGQRGRSFFGAIKRNTTDGVYKSQIDGSLNSHGEMAFTEQQTLWKDPSGQPVKCIAHGTLAKDVVDGTSTAGTKTFAWHFQKNYANYIDLQDRSVARVDSLRFFESAKDPPPPPSRQYSTVFSRNRARFISWQVDLRFASLGAELRVPVKGVFYAPNGKQLWSRDEDHTLNPGWSQAWLASGYGNPKPGTWKPGKYRVVVYIAGQEAADGEFTLH